jgi:hypothetical protein
MLNRHGILLHCRVACGFKLAGGLGEGLFCLKGLTKIEIIAKFTKTINNKCVGHKFFNNKKATCT